MRQELGHSISSKEVLPLERGERSSRKLGGLEPHESLMTLLRKRHFNRTEWCESSGNLTSQRQ